MPPKDVPAADNPKDTISDADLDALLASVHAKQLRRIKERVDLDAALALDRVRATGPANSNP